MDKYRERSEEAEGGLYGSERGIDMFFLGMVVGMVIGVALMALMQINQEEKEA